jgi:hypothetical protein
MFMVDNYIPSKLMSSTINAENPAKEKKRKYRVKFLDEQDSIKGTDSDSVNDSGFPHIPSGSMTSSPETEKTSSKVL